MQVFVSFVIYFAMLNNYRGNSYQDNFKDIDQKLIVCNLVFYCFQFLSVLANTYYFVTNIQVKQNAQYLEHKKQIFTQSVAIALFCLINIVCDSIHYSYLENYDGTDNNYDYKYLRTFSICAFLEVFAVFGFIYAKEPEDCFRCFNRLPNLKYSSWSGDVRQNSTVFLPYPKEQESSEVGRLTQS